MFAACLQLFARVNDGVDTSGLKARWKYDDDDGVRIINKIIEICVSTLFEKSIKSLEVGAVSTSLMLRCRKTGELVFRFLLMMILEAPCCVKLVAMLEGPLNVLEEVEGDELEVVEGVLEMVEEELEMVEGELLVVEEVVEHFDWKFEVA